ncbi:MAG: DUF4124 domain-containing protein [Burkholderiales bacterium]|nr:DUF4124 domain-containing protein [Burkholderiales bacterium]
MSAAVRLALAAVLLAAATAADAQICRWKDASGVHYGDKPPPGVKCDRSVAGATAAPSAAAPAPVDAGDADAAAKDGEPKPPGSKPAPKTAKDLDAEFRKRRLEKQEAEKRAAADRAQEALKRENCESSKARVNGLKNGGRVTRYTAAGEAYYLSDDQIAEELAAAQRNVDLSCK